MNFVWVCTDKIRQFFLSLLSISALLPFHVDFQLGLGIESSRFHLFSGSLKMQLHPSDFCSSLVESKWVLLPDGSVELQNPQNTIVQPSNKVICRKYDTYVQRAAREREGGESCPNFDRFLVRFFLFCFVEWYKTLQKFVSSGFEAGTTACKMEISNVIAWPLQSTVIALTRELS